MAAFFHGGSEIQDSYSDLTLQQQNPFLMNPNCLTYPTTRFFNPSAGHAPVHAPPTEQLLVGVPTTMDMTTTSGHNHHHYYNLFFGSHLDHPNPTHNINSDSVEFRGFDLLPREPPLPPLAVVSSGNCKRLSLSLSSKQRPPAASSAGMPYIRSGDTDHMEQGNSPTVSNGIVLGVKQYGGRGGGSGVFDPKYLKAARELLDEIVSIANNNVNGSIEKMIKMEKESTAGDGISRVGSENSGGCGRAVGGDLTTASKQELQIKKAKLVSMVDEVEIRYKQYRYQMQTLFSSFEQAAGFTSARSYTCVALQTISKQFRCLKDSISSQIKIINKSLGEVDCVVAKGESSRFGRFIVGHHNHNHNLHQLRHVGMIQNYHHNNAWRPQRGLPEQAVSVLRAWLFEHFLHPYPRDSDKQMLAKQTGLTRSQVSNWFINARVRLWKPMVEEMYLEEMKNQSQTKPHNLNQASSPRQPWNYILQKHNNNNASDQCSSSNILPSTSYLSTLVSPRIKKPGTMTTAKVQNDVVPMQNSSCNVVSFDMADSTKEHGDHTAVTAISDFNGGFRNYNATYGNWVSLSLGLPSSCDQRVLGNIQFGKRSHEIEFSGVSASSTYQNFDISDKKGFDAAVTTVTTAAPLLPDFLA